MINWWRKWPTWSRLITLTGPGGVGKTSLALAVARRSGGHAWLVELAELEPGADRDRLAEAVAAAAPERAEGALLVLDNCEHVIDAAADLATGLLAAEAGLTILATSREALGVAGEQRWPVPPLPLPDSATDAADSAAVQLFA